MLHKSHWLDLCHPSTLASVLLQKSEEADDWTVCLDMQRLLQHSSCFDSTGGPPFLSPMYPSSHTSLGTARGAVRHAGAHSFLSDTELSHCEQFLCGSMLTNELSSVSSEKSCQSANRSRKSELCVHRSARENIVRQLVKIMQIFNGGRGFRSNNVYGSPAVIYPNENVKSAAGR